MKLSSKMSLQNDLISFYKRFSNQISKFGDYFTLHYGIAILKVSNISYFIWKNGFRSF